MAFNNNNKIIQFYNMQINFELSFFKSSLYKIGIFVDRECRNKTLLQRLFTQCSQLYLYGSIYKWLIVSTDFNTTLDSLDDMNFSIETDLVIAVPNKNEYVLHEVYNPCKYRQGKLIVNQIGTWRSGHFDVTFFDKNVSRRWDYGGIKVKIAGLIVYRPKTISVENYLQAYKNISKDSMTKFTYAVILHFADIFNFTVEPGEFREWKADDDVGPVCKALYNRQIDIGGSPLLTTETRMNYVLFLYPLWPFRTFFIFRTTTASHIRITEFLMPLATDCWYLTAFLTIIVIITFGTLLSYENINNKMEAYGVGFIITIGSLCQQGSAYMPIKSPGRIALFSILLFSLLVYNYYSASVVSSRLSKPLDKINDSLVELAKTDLSLAAEPSLFFNFILNQSEWDLEEFNRMRWRKIPEKDRFILPEEGIKKVWEGKFAYHTTPEAGYPLIERTFDNRRICELTEVHTKRPTFLYLNTCKNSPFTEISKLGTIRMFERGLLKRQIRRWQIRTPECRKDVLSAESIKLVEVAPCFLLWISGVVLSLTIFIFEKAIYYKHHIR